jgi:glutathione reductase (NADPH)
MAQAGITTLHGFGRFTGPRSVDAGGRELTADHVVVATGAEPRPLDMPGADLATGSEAFMELDELPRNIVFMGGGYISFEFAHVAARAGADVTILHRSGRVLKQFDPDLVDTLVRAGESLGIAVRTDTPVRGIERRNGRLAVLAGEDGDQIFQTDLAVHGMGRVPSVRGLNLEAAGVECCDHHGIQVNEFMQSVSNPAVYAVGDVTDTGMPLTPVAAMQAATAAHNIRHGPTRRADYSGTPSVVFTYPPLAAVGSLEQELKDAGTPYEVRMQDASQWSDYRRIGQEHAASKLLVHPETGMLLGAHLLGAGSEEVVNVFGLAMRYGIQAKDLKKMPWSYPSYVYTIKYMA